MDRTSEILKQDLYGILQVPEDATEEQIKKAFRRAALLSHPDRNLGRKETEERFKQASHAYSILGDSRKRRRYDLYRELVFFCDRWGIRLGRRRDRLLESFFLKHELPVVAEHLLSSLRDARSLRRTAPPAASRWPVLLVLRVLKAVHRELRSRTGERAASRLGERPFRASLLRSLHRNAAGRRRPRSPVSRPQGDVEWPLAITCEEAAAGNRLNVSFLQDSRWSRIVLRVPGGVRTGTKIRLRGKGNRIPGTDRRGDLYLKVTIH
ncbi:MAG: DnaJ domain-containing protein [bacterium]